MKLRLVHVQLPDGTVSQPKPIGQVLEMLERGEISPDTQICDHGSTQWNALRYEPAVMRPHTRAERPPVIAEDPTPDDPRGRLRRAAIFFAGLSLVGGLLASAAFGMGYFFAGLSGPLGIAFTLLVVSWCVQGRQP